MILDQTTLFSDAQAVTTTAPSTNSIDLLQMGKIAYNGGTIKRNTGHLEIPMIVQVVEDFAGLTSLAVEFQSDEDPAFGSPTTLSSRTVGVAELKAGFNIMDSFPSNIKERYIRLNYVVVGTGTAGKLTAGVVSAVDGRYQG